MTLSRGLRFGRTRPLSPRHKAMSSRSWSCYIRRRREGGKYVAIESRITESNYRFGVRDRRGALFDSRDSTHASGYLSQSEPARNLCCATVWRNVTSANGRIPGLLLRISFPLHHGNRVGRIQVHSERRIVEARISSRHRYEPGGRANRWICGPRSRIHAAWNGGAIHHAIRRGKRAGGISRFLERHPERRRNPG